MKILQIKIIAIILLLPIFSNAQSDCMSWFDIRQPEQTFSFNSASKAARCVTGKTYEFILPLTKGKDYKLKFYAAAVFNNKMNFKIIDQNTHETVLDLPGTCFNPEAGNTVLQDYYDDATGKMIHPYFEFFPTTSTTFKIIIDIEEAPGNPKITDDPERKSPRKQNKGCVTIVVLDKLSEDF